MSAPVAEKSRASRVGRAPPVSSGAARLARHLSGHQERGRHSDTVTGTVSPVRNGCVSSCCYGAWGGMFTFDQRHNPLFSLIFKLFAHDTTPTETLLETTFTGYVRLITRGTSLPLSNHDSSNGAIGSLRGRSFSLYSILFRTHFFPNCVLGSLSHS